MFAHVWSGALVGVNALPVQVEVNSGEYGEPRIFMVGLPDAAVKESSDRVCSALQNSGFEAHPRSKYTINLAPGDLRKEGPLFDLPIALGILISTGDLKTDTIDRYLIAGELSLSGAARPVKGGLALALLARKLGKDGVVLPRQSAMEAALVEGIKVYPVDSLDEAVRFFEGGCELPLLASTHSPFKRRPDAAHALDFSEVKGQHTVRRAVEIAVAGGHNLLMIGPPGSGKSMIAKRIPTIMPEPTLEEFLEILAVHSAAGISLREENRFFQRPFRSPHHTISDAGLIGGGTHPGPGEISLAHNGVLFLDELPEFQRGTLEVLRQPLEDGEVTISRSAAKVTLPASVMLVAAMNPTPGGYSSKDGRENHATPAQIQRYRSKISGPLLDRIDIHVEAPALGFAELRSNQPGESSHTLRARIYNARERQRARFKIAADVQAHTQATACNARMGHREIRHHCAIEGKQGDLLQQAMEHLKLSARAYDRILKVARTIADLDSSERIGDAHLMEAIQYRSLDRALFH